MVRLPMSDDAASYYKEQRIEFTFRQQAHFCWAYDPLLKDRMKSLREILEISDDERLNMEIRQRLAYEEEIYARFMANDMDVSMSSIPMMKTNTKTATSDPPRAQ